MFTDRDGRIECISPESSKIRGRDYDILNYQSLVDNREGLPSVLVEKVKELFDYIGRNRK